MSLWTSHHGFQAKSFPVYPLVHVVPNWKQGVTTLIPTSSPWERSELYTGWSCVSPVTQATGALKITPTQCKSAVFTKACYFTASEEYRVCLKHSTIPAGCKSHSFKIILTHRMLCTDWQDHRMDGKMSASIFFISMTPHFTKPFFKCKHKCVALYTNIPSLT